MCGLTPVAAAAIFLVAQEASPAVVETLRANAEALQAYTHKRRIVVTLKGRSRTRLEQVRYVEGEAQTTPLGGPGDGMAAPPARKAGQRRAVARKIERFLDDTERLKVMLEQYLQPGRALLQSARVEPVAGQKIRVTASGVVRPKDRVEILWDSAANQPETFAISTDLEGSALEIRLKFARIADGGPFHASIATLTQPAKDLTIRLENFDYVR